ncbi:NAD(P)/FAD-dependent oxidoreductase [Actinomadura sp. 9N215]|uniref:NAD(P)/FAD-dependent oxidoreductase n=1 Tax=Actinomadura sp. 9N215 TaxID=3375150 RepID=UPI0037B015B1
MRERFDVIVVGARCAGASVAMLLAREGHSVLLLDRGRVGDDVVSTHYVHRSGIRRLDQWGLLDDLRATGCPALTASRQSIEGVTLEDVSGPDRRVAAYGPRRHVLDGLLARAATASGARLRERTGVRALIRTGPAVTGVVATRPDGARTEIEARLVIGADGANSTVARLVRARAYRELPALTCVYYTYWTGLDGPMSFTVQDRRAALAVPTHGGATCVGILWPRTELPRIRRDIENEYLTAAAALIPEFAAAGTRLRRTERFYGSANQTGFFRAAAGPGWALAGDAGHRKDPITASGISDAFEQAAMLAPCAHRALTGRQDTETALRPYWTARDAHHDVPYRVAHVLATLRYPPRVLDAMRRTFPVEETQGILPALAAVLLGPRDASGRAAR